MHVLCLVKTVFYFWHLDDLIFAFAVSSDEAINTLGHASLCSYSEQDKLVETGLLGTYLLKNFMKFCQIVSQERHPSISKDENVHDTVLDLQGSYPLGMSDCPSPQTYHLLERA